MAMANRCSQRSLLLYTVLLLITTIIISVVSGQPGGVFLSLNGITIPNDGYIVAGDIGVEEGGLYCNTDRIDCCRGSDAPDGVAGHWYRPDGTQVGSFTQEVTNDPSRNFFYRDRGARVVRLNHAGTALDRGRFRCEIPNAAGVNVTVYVNIVTVTVSITSSGTAAAGESYSLECTVIVTGSNDQPTITWLMGPMDNMITSGVMTTGGMSTLTFDPLAASDTGTYTCRATLGSAMDSESTTITVQSVYLSLKGVVYANNSAIQITAIGETNSMSNTGLQCITDRSPCCATPPNRFGEWYFPNEVTVPSIAGAPTTFYRNRGDDGTVNLNRLNTNIIMPTGLFCCEVPDGSGTMQRVCANITSGPTVQIRDSGATPAPGQGYSLTCEVSGASGPVSAYQWRRDGIEVSAEPTLSFSSLTLSDAGQYICQVSVEGMIINSPPQDIRLTIPSIASVSVTSIPSSPISVASSVTVICTVELNSAIVESDVSLLIVSAQLSKDGTQLALSGPTVTGTTFTYTTQLSSFGRSDSGNYTCTATMRPQPTATHLFGTVVHSNAIKLTTFQVNFQFIDKESMNISFSLTCNSTGVQASSVVWTRDGFLLDNSNPLVMTDASTLSYTSVLTVSGRTPGTYTCTIRGTNDQDLGSANLIVQASAPPVDAVATQSGSSAPVEVSWSPSSDAARAIIGYRIFYGNGQNLLVPSYVTRIVLNFVESSQIESVSVRSESSQLPSELITATVATTASSEETLCTCSSEVGTAVGVVILVVGIIAAVTAITVVICWSVMRRRKSDNSDFAVSANMAYGQVRLGALGDAGGEYEDPDKVAGSGRGMGGGGGNYEPTGCPAPYEFPVSISEAPVYATADDTNSGKTV